MKKIIIIFILFTSFYATEAKAQVTEEWIRIYNGTGIGGYNADKATVDVFGNFIVAGRAGYDNDDYLILKYSSSGELLWDRRYNGPANNLDLLQDMVLDDSGNIYVTGVSWEGTAFGGQNWVTIKYNSMGDLKWKQSLDWTGHNADRPNCIYLDKDRNVLVAGYGFVGPGFFNDDIVVAKYNFDGELLWTNSYNCFGTIGDWGYSVVSDESCSAYVSGYSKLENNPSQDVIVTIKYDSAGKQIWVREFLRAYGEYAIPLYSRIDRNNNVVICGNYNPNTDFVTIKYDGQGHLLWSRYFNGVGNNLDFCNDMCIDNNSNIYICGRAVYPITTDDLLLIKYKANGDTCFIRYYDVGNNFVDEALAVVVDSLENVYLTGGTTIIGDDFLTVKYNSGGDISWSKVYSLPMANKAYGIGIDKYNNVYITGSTNSSGVSRIVSIKYSQLTGIENSSNMTITNYSLTNYPNPFNPITTIEFEIPEYANVEIDIYDNKGKKMEMLTNEYKRKGDYKIMFNGIRYSSGVYFCTLIINNYIIRTNKMLLIR